MQVYFYKVTKLTDLFTLKMSLPGKKKLNKNIDAKIRYSPTSGLYMMLLTFKWSSFPVYTPGSIRPQQLIE